MTLLKYGGIFADNVTCDDVF